MLNRPPACSCADFGESSCWQPFFVYLLWILVSGPLSSFLDKLLDTLFLSTAKIHVPEDITPLLQTFLVSLLFRVSHYHRSLIFSLLWLSRYARIQLLFFADYLANTPLRRNTLPVFITVPHRTATGAAFSRLYRWLTTPWKETINLNTNVFIHLASIPSP